MITGFINAKKIDFNQRENITLAKAFADITDPSSRGATLVLDFVLPPTPNNHEAFRDSNNPHSDLNFQGKYNMTIYAQGALIAQGVFVLKSVSSEGYKGYLSYADNQWLDFFENSKLKDVAWSDELCQSQFFIQGTNRNGLDDKFCFPLVDYGNISEAVFNASPIYSSDIFPAVFIYPLLRDLFSAAGWELSSNWFLQETNYNLILPFTNDDMRLKDPTINLEDVDYIETTTNPGAINLTTVMPIILPISTIDIDKDNMLVGISSGFVFNVKPEWNGLTCGNIRGFNVEINLNGSFLLSGGLSSFLIVETLRNGTPVNTQSFFLPVGVPTVVNYLYTLPNLVGTEQVAIKIYKASGGTITNTTPTKAYATRLKVAKYDYEFLRFYLREQLPDITPYELLKSLVQMYNLYIITDNATKTVRLEPIDAITQASLYEYEDWRNRCSAKNNELLFIKDELPAKFIYKYAEGSDYLCELVQKATGYPYGTKIIDTGANNSDTTETDFVIAPTVHRRVGQFYIACYWQGDYSNPTSATDFSFETGTEPRICKYVQAQTIAPVQIRSDTTLGNYNLLPAPLYGTAVFEVSHEILNPAPLYLLPEFLGHNLKFEDMQTGTLKDGLYKRWYAKNNQKNFSSKKATLRVKIFPKDFQDANLFIKRKLISITIGDDRYTVLAYLNEIKDYIPNLEQLTTCEFIII